MTRDWDNPRPRRRSAPYATMGLVLRSPDNGEGWRTVSDIVWNSIEQVVEDFPELFETSKTIYEVRLLRLTPEAMTLMKWRD